MADNNQLEQMKQKYAPVLSAIQESRSSSAMFISRTISCSSKVWLLPSSKPAGSGAGASDGMKIFEANRDVLNDPNKISPGQTLKIPA